MPSRAGPHPERTYVRRAKWDRTLVRFDAGHGTEHAFDHMHGHAATCYDNDVQGPTSSDKDGTWTGRPVIEPLRGVRTSLACD